MQTADLAAGLITSLAITVLAIPSIVRVALSKGLYGVIRDRLNVGKKVPTLGGLAIFAALVIPLNLFMQGDHLPQLHYLTAGALILFFIGIKDDILVIAPWWKLAGQVLAALLISIPGGMVLHEPLYVFGISGTAGWLDIAITVIFIVAIINAYNFIDGIDAMAALYGIMVTAITGWFMYEAGLGEWAFLAVVLFGGLAGFSWFNIFSRKRKIYMGDTGTLVAGFILAVLAVRFFNLENPELFNRELMNRSAFLMALFLVPGYDLTRIIVVRIWKKKIPWKPDRRHIHYRMVDAGMSHMEVSLTLTGLSLVMALACIFINGLPELLLMAGIFMVTLVLSILPGFFLRKRKRILGQQRKIY